ncbi:MAG: S8 family peptidase [Paraclostridium sp.]
MKKYSVTLRNIKYNCQFECFLKCHKIRYNYLNDIQIYTIYTNENCIECIKQLCYIKYISNNCSAKSYIEPPIIPISINVNNTEKTEDYPDINWGLDRIKAPDFWKLGYTGQGVNVAILDTGVAKHKSLDVKQRLSFIDNDFDVYDTLGHGTMVAGIIAANPDKGPIAGVAYNCNLYSLKVVFDIEDNQIEIDAEAVLEALEWCIDNDIQVVNMSFGYENIPCQEDDIEMLSKALDKAYEKGIILISTSGNTNTEDELEAPGFFKNVIAVGATDINDNRWVDYELGIGSNYGTGLDFMAPGSKIASTFLDNGEAIADGTSFSAPYVTGIVALLLSQNPNLTQEKIIDILIGGAIQLPKGKPDFNEYGYGLVQASD